MKKKLESWLSSTLGIMWMVSFSVATVAIMVLAIKWCLSVLGVL